jgi:hypothetical protein
MLRVVNSNLVACAPKMPRAQLQYTLSAHLFRARLANQPRRVRSHGFFTRQIAFALDILV